MYKFTDKRPDEKIIRVLRRHKIVFLKPALYSLIILVLLGLAFYFLVLETWLASLVLIIAAIIIGGLFFLYWYLWANDLYILTDQRLIDVDQNAIFSRRVNEMSLDKIQDVTYEVAGFLPTAFNFGKVIIKTAGPAEDIVIETIPSPSKVTEEISTNFKAYREKRGLISTEAPKQNIPNQPVPNQPIQPPKTTVGGNEL